MLPGQRRSLQRRPLLQLHVSGTSSIFLLAWRLQKCQVLTSSRFTRQFHPRGYSCRYAVNDCDISETCSGDSGQVPLILLGVFNVVLFISDVKKLEGSLIYLLFLVST